MDLKSCYDCIVHSFTKIAMEQNEIPKEPLVCMFITLQSLEHYIQTVFGDSAISFNGKLWIVLIQGSGQGNGASPAIWAIVSSPVLKMLWEEGHGAYFQALISGEELRFVGYAFVDDTDLITSPANAPNLSYKEVGEQMQAAMMAWDGGITVTGGAMVPEKTFWYLVDFKWMVGKWQYATLEETLATLQVKDCNGWMQMLTRLPVDQVEWTLGVCVAPDGNMKNEFEYLQSVAKEWGERTHTGHLPKQLTWQSLSITIMKKLEYPLPAMVFTEKQCVAILWPLLTPALQAMGIQGNFPRDLVHGPVKYQGLGILNLYVSQGIAHIDWILKYGTAEEHLMGKLI